MVGASLTRLQDRLYGLCQLLSYISPMRRMVARNGTKSFRRAFSPATYNTIVAEDFPPSSLAR